MLAVKSAVRNAKTEARVLYELVTFIDHLKRYRMQEILPEQLANLSADDAEDVRAWARRLRKRVHDRYCLTAAGQLWFDEICETYFAAAERLDEFTAKESQDAGEVHEMKSSDLAPSVQAVRR
jgi:hypothetical protein